MNATRPVGNESHLDDAHCADLALGLVPGDERAASLEHARACPTCEARLRAHVAAGERASAEARTRFGSDLQLVPGIAPGVVPARRTERAVRLSALAAAAVLALTVAVPLIQQPPPDRDPAHRLPPLGEAVRMRGGRAEDSHLAAGLAAYQARDWATAERELSAARAEDGNERLRRLVLAQVRYDRGRAGDALDLLRGIDWRAIPDPWRRDGEALYARVLRASGRASTADSIERALRSSPPGAPFVP